MRRIALAFVILGFATSPSFAQKEKDAPLKEILAGWEKALGALTSLSMECERTTVDNIFESTEIFKGSIKLLKAGDPRKGFLASLEMLKMEKGQPVPNRYEKFIVTGSDLYEFDPGNKVIRKHAIAPGKGGQRDDNVLSFVFGKKAGDVLNRYTISSVPAKKDDKYYFYVKIEPKHEQDKADFTEAHVALYKSNLLTAMISYRQPNGNQVTWLFTKVEPNAKLTERDFAAPEPPPPEWTLQKMPAR